jgi:hypothetical protein
MSSAVSASHGFYSDSCSVGCGLKQRPRGQQFDLGALEKASGEQCFLLQKLMPLDFFPEDVGAFGDQQFGCNQLGFLAEHQCLRRTV